MNNALRNFLRQNLSENEIKFLPRSFDVIGDIAIIEIPKELEAKKEIIGKALLNFKHIKVVMNKKGKVEGVYRTRDLEIIAGENRTETIYKEYGCRYVLDVQKMYFSPRLGNERNRIAEQVNEKERVLVMFAGVGPYAILIAKKKKTETYAIELNHDACEYMYKNIKINKVNVHLIEGDVAEETHRLGKFDRIIMPLPKDCKEFLDVALNALNKNGIIHYYGFSHSPEEFSEEIKEKCRNLGYEINVLAAVRCGSYAPRIDRVCVDFRV